MLLELLGRPHQVIDVEYGQRSELARVTGGYIYVPVWVDEQGAVTVESRRITELLLADGAGRALVPAPLEGPIWAYADFCDGPLEDLLFRIATPDVRDAWSDPWERALYTLTKERKFGPGCIEQWRVSRPALLDKARELLAPTVRTLESVPFLFGQNPTLADAALYGMLAMLHEANPELPSTIHSTLRTFMTRVEGARRTAP